MPQESQPASFGTTNWSLVGKARDVDPAVRRAALDDLLRRYVPALRAFLVRRLALQAAEADDLVQGFVADKVLTQNLLGKIDAQRGRLRSVLVKVLQRYAYDALRKRAAEDRRLQQIATIAGDETREHDDAFALEWARHVLRLALDRARRECQEKARLQEWELLEVRILQPAFRGTPPLPYETLLQRFGFRDVKQAENALVTAKRRLRRAIEETIGRYAEPQEIDDEIADLLRLAACAPGGAACETASDEAAERAPADDELDASGAGSFAALLGQTDPRTAPWSDEEMSQFVARALAGRCPGASEGSSIGGGQTIGEALLAERPSAEGLARVKRWAAAQAASGSAELPTAVYRALHDAAIATALVTTGKLISRSPRGAVVKRLGALASHSWVPPSLRATASVAAGLLEE